MTQNVSENTGITYETSHQEGRSEWKKHVWRMAVQRKSEPVTELASRMTKDQETEITCEGSIRMWY